MQHYHAVVWLDHQEAKVYSLNWHAEAAEWRIKDHDRPTHLHHKAGPSAGAGKAPPNEAFYHAVAHALEGAGEVLVVGPGTAKSEFLQHIERHDPTVAHKIVGVESVDHPSEGELVAFARKRFTAIDAIRPPNRTRH